MGKGHKNMGLTPPSNVRISLGKSQLEMGIPFHPRRLGLIDQQQQGINSYITRVQY